MRNDPTGMGDVIVTTGSGNWLPLAVSTSTTFARTIRFRYVAEMTRLSSSIKLITEFMIVMKRGFASEPYAPATAAVNYKLQQYRLR